MRRKNERITTLGALMSAMTIDWGSRKTYAEIHYVVHQGEVTCRVDEHFDDGKGHSGAFTSTRSDVDVLVFEEAKSKGFITGKLEPGYVSTREFVLTDNKMLLSEEIWPLVKVWQEKDYYLRRSLRDVQEGKSGTYIQIVNVPEGEAPEHIRAAWVGMILPSEPIVGYSDQDSRERGALTGAINVHNRYRYAVPQQEALALLERKQPDAVRWWKENGFPKGGDGITHFSFSEQEVQEFAGSFTHQQIHVHDELLGELDH